MAAFLASAVSPGEQQWCKLQRCIPDLVGLPHRLELIHKDVHGSRWLNDSKATNVESVQVCQAGCVFCMLSRAVSSRCESDLTVAWTEITYIHVYLSLIHI